MISTQDSAAIIIVLVIITVSIMTYCWQSLFISKKDLLQLSCSLPELQLHFALQSSFCSCHSHSVCGHFSDGYNLIICSLVTRHQ